MLSLDPYIIFNINSLVLKLGVYLIPKIRLFYIFFCFWKKTSCCLNNIAFLNTSRTLKI